MSKNSRTKEAEALLERARKLLPDELAFAKSFISKALVEIINYSSDKIKKIPEKTLADKWTEDLQKGLTYMNPIGVNRTLEGINKMIALEEEKLKKLKEKKLIDAGDDKNATLID
jgi:hypothetical protein